MLEGTLYGRWPHTGIWACLLSMVDQHGHINKNPQLIANAVGCPLDQLLACIADFMSPDSGSQSKENEGRRLELLDPSRDWGWRVINSGKYREKARLMGKAKRESESGQTAARLRERRRTPTNAGKRPSDSYTDIYINKDKKKTEEAQAPVPGLDSESWTRWLTYRSESGKPLKPASIPAAQRKLASFGTQQSAVVEESIANGYQGLFAPKNNRSGAKVSEWE